MIKQRPPKFKSSFSIDGKGMIDLACALISKKTINLPGDEYLVKDIVVKSMKELGMKVKIFGDKKRPNILGEIGNGHPSIAILCHMDVVPPGRDWKTDPFRPTIKNGRLYGRGACDDKGPYAASWAAIKAVLQKGKPKGKIILGAVADEERGSEKGIKLLLKKKILDCDFCLIPDGGRIDEAVIGEKGMLWLKFVSIGKSAHGSNPEKGVNAITNMTQFLSNIIKLKINTPLEVFIPLEIKFLTGQAKCAAVPTSCRDLLLTGFTPMTINLGEIKGGDAPNIVPSYCEATIDIRYPLGIKKKEIMEKIKLLMNSFNKNRGKIILKEIIQDTLPHLLDIKAHPFLKTFLEASKETGEKMKFVTIGGNSVGKLLYFAGIPSFSHSPEDIPTAHQANESVSLKNLQRCAILWAKFLEKILNDRVKGTK